MAFSASAAGGVAVCPVRESVMQAEKLVMGFAWYDAESFEALKQQMPDMSASYDDWRLGAQKDLRKHEKQGYRVIRIAVRPQEFFTWCRGRGVLAPGVRDRQQFAANGARIVLRAERGTERRGFSLF